MSTRLCSRMATTEPKMTGRTRDQIGAVEEVGPSVVVASAIARRIEHPAPRAVKPSKATMRIPVELTASLESVRHSTIGSMRSFVGV